MSSHKKAFGKTLDVLGNIIEICGVITAALLFSLIAYQIVLRVFFAKGDPMAGEIVSYAFIWLVYIGMAVAAKNRDHIMVTMLVDSIKGKGKCVVEIISRLLWLYYSIYIVWASTQLIGKVNLLKSVTPVMHTPMFILYMIIPVTHLITGVYIVRDIVELIQVLQGKLDYKATKKPDLLDELQKGEAE